MKKYNTRPIDFTGCHPVIAEHLKRGEEIECFVHDFSTHHGHRSYWVYAYFIGEKYPYRTRTEGLGWRYAEPIPIKTKRIMPPERAIPALIAGGWAFDAHGALNGEPYCIVPQMFAKMGRPLEDISWKWPDCIIEEVEDDE